MLNDDTKEAIKSIAKSIGKGFSSDVGMITKFAYASTESEFKNALEDAAFRMAKGAALEEVSRNWIEQKDLSLLFDALDNQEFSEIKNYFVSFMSAQVITENYTSKQK